MAHAAPNNGFKTLSRKPIMMTSPTRRKLLAVTGGSIALAGCLGEDDGAIGGTDNDGAADGTDADESDDGQEAVRPDWQDATLEDVTTDEEFTVAEVDRPVVIHTFATYCPTCNSHQDGVSDDYGDVSDELLFVDLSVDENDDPADIRDHAEANGHEWRFGVAPNEVTTELIDAFGQSVATPSQSPLIVVCPDGSTATMDKPATIAEIEETVDTSCE